MIGEHQTSGVEKKREERVESKMFYCCCIC